MSSSMAFMHAPAITEQQLALFEDFILRAASLTLHKVVCKSDDEWSVALAAFVEATRSYDPIRGGFEAHARFVIAHRLIDDIRCKRKYYAEYPVSPVMFSGDENQDAPLQRYVQRVAHTEDESALRDEIAEIGAILLDYGFTFDELPECSPCARKTRTACINVIHYMAAQPLLFSKLRATKRLPITELERSVPADRKILERYRKYIIAATEICCGDFPGIQAYLRGKDGKP